MGNMGNHPSRPPRPLMRANHRALLARTSEPPAQVAPIGEFEEEESSYHVMVSPQPPAPVVRRADRWLFFVGAGMLTMLLLGNLFVLALRNWSIGSVTLMVMLFTFVMFGRAFPRG